MSSNYEKSVKGATKIKVRRTDSYVHQRHAKLMILATACAAQIQVH